MKKFGYQTITDMSDVVFQPTGFKKGEEEKLYNYIYNSLFQYSVDFTDNCINCVRKWVQHEPDTDFLKKWGEITDRIKLKRELLGYFYGLVGYILLSGTEYYVAILNDEMLIDYLGSSSMVQKDVQIDSVVGVFDTTEVLDDAIDEIGEYFEYDYDPTFDQCVAFSS